MKKLIRHLTYLIIVVSFSLFPPLLTPDSVTDEETAVIIAEPEKNNTSVFDITEKERQWIDSVLNKMTIRERVAQMIMPWAGGNYTSESSSDYKRLEFLIEDLKVGGLIFFKGDILNEALLINKFQQMADVPLLISSDFERGLAMRLTDATEFPYNMAVAATGDVNLVREMGRIVSLESRAIGVHQNYAPVADINTNADNPIINIRAYSEDQNIVAEYCEAFIDGSVEGRMISTIKHFPGHGSTDIDSHKDLPVINVSMDDLMKFELAPFISSIKAGVQSVMIGHLSVPSIDSQGVPATLSKRIVTDLLKDELGFKGLVVTDAMNMNAVTKFYSSAEAAVLGVKAGNDILLMPPDEEIAINAIAEAVYNGEIEIERINESVRKILSAKVWVGLDKEKNTDINAVPAFVGTKNNVFLAHEIAEKSITLVKDENNLIPIDPAKYYSTAVITISDGNGTGAYFNELADQEFGYIRTISLNKRSTDKEYKQALEIARKSDLILLPSFIKVKAYQGTVKMSDKQTRFMKSVFEMDKPYIVISFGNPYLLSFFTETKTYLTAYGDAAVSQRAMLRAVTGKTDITGRLPISIPGTGFKTGDGIKLVHNRLVKDAEGLDFPAAERLVKNGIKDSIFPAASVVVTSGGKIVYSRSFGKTDFDENSPSVTGDYIYDIDEITSLFTTTAALVLSSEDILNLDGRVAYYLPEYENKFLIVRDLLFKEQGQFNSHVAAAAREGTDNSALLQRIMERVTGTDLDKIIHDKISVPLNLRRTFFNPPREYWFYTLPTSEEISSVKRNKGVVFNDKAYNMHGVSGNAGLFMSAEDLAVFLQLLLQRGNYNNNELIREDIFNRWYKDINEELFIEGHTGTALYLNPSENKSVLILTNSIYTGDTEKFRAMLPEFYESVKATIK